MLVALSYFNVSDNAPNAEKSVPTKATRVNLLLPQFFSPLFCCCPNKSADGGFICLLVWFIRAVVLPMWRLGRMQIRADQGSTMYILTDQGSTCISVLSRLVLIHVYILADQQEQPGREWCLSRGRNFPHSSSTSFFVKHSVVHLKCNISRCAAVCCCGAIQKCSRCVTCTSSWSSAGGSFIFIISRKSHQATTSSSDTKMLSSWMKIASHWFPHCCSNLMCQEKPGSKVAQNRSAL